MGELFRDARIIGFDQLLLGTGIPFSQNEYLMLVSAASYAREKYGNKPGSNGKALSLFDGIYVRKTSSRIFRKILERKDNEINVADLQVVRTFYRLVDIPIPDNKCLGIIHSI